MAEFKLTEARLRQIRHRQWKLRWGAEYVPAIFANPIEAPGISTGTILSPQKLGGRDVHTLSTPETTFALLGLYNPNCWDMHEQHVLFPTPRPHPLYGHPLAVGNQFPEFRGTLDVARRLGVRHPRVTLGMKDAAGNCLVAPFPYLGDLRMFMCDELGAYCVNLPVKNKFADFRIRGPRRKPRRIADLDDPATVARQALEETYNADAGIRTHPVAMEQMPVDLMCNLKVLFLEEDYEVNLEKDLRPAAMEFVRGHIGRDIPAFAVALALAKQFHVSPREAKALIVQGIWRREVRIDLFRPFLMNKPLRPEVVDVLQRFAAIFAR